ncbi:MAG: hypothetical protein IJO01_00605 [Oscillospiraceae bacterium]|nr:hypothetical protein [Oscillospiraceae bacterium]
MFALFRLDNMPPFSLTAQRNRGVTAKETPSNHCIVPTTAVPLHNGTKSTTKKQQFQILAVVAVFEVNNGFYLCLLARLFLIMQDGAAP